MLKSFSNKWAFSLSRKIEHNTYWALSLALAPDSSERADRVLVPLRVLLKLSQAWFCWAMSWTRCSREKWVPWARFLYSAAFLRSSMTSANQLLSAGVLSSTAGPLCNKENLIDRGKKLCNFITSFLFIIFIHHFSIN